VQWRRAWLLHTGTVRVTVGIYRTLYWYNQHMFLYLGSPLSRSRNTTVRVLQRVLCLRHPHISVTLIRHDLCLSRVQLSDELGPSLWHRAASIATSPPPPRQQTIDPAHCRSLSEMSTILCSVPTSSALPPLHVPTWRSYTIITSRIEGPTGRER
jgi:hypothetical protein